MNKLILIALTACSVTGKTFPPGTYGGDCYANMTCNMPLTCDQGICLGPQDGGTDGRKPGDGSGSSGYACADDSMY